MSKNSFVTEVTSKIQCFNWIKIMFKTMVFYVIHLSFMDAGGIEGIEHG